MNTEEGKKPGDIGEVIQSLLLEGYNDPRKRRTLILVLGKESRSQFESIQNTTSTIGSILRSKKDVGVLFLNNLQYLFMYLMKLEVQPDTYNHLVVYGLDTLIDKSNISVNGKARQGNELTTEQVRAANLIYQTAFKVQRTHQLHKTNFVNYNENKSLENIEKFWHSIC